MAAYDELASVYDELMDDFDYDQWAAHYLALARAVGVFPKRICECACGTGSMSMRFAASGLRVTGIDLSESMLARAQIRSREAGVQITYVRQDMCRLELPRPVDAVFCTCDGVNYLTESDQLHSFLQHVHSCLKPGGAFVFDISSAYKLRNLLGGGFFGETREHLAYLWSNRFDETSCTVEMALTFFVEYDEDVYHRFEETHIQRAYETEELVRALEKNGFDVRLICGDFTMEAPKPDSKRIHFAAVRL